MPSRIDRPDARQARLREVLDRFLRQWDQQQPEQETPSIELLISQHPN